MGFLTTRKVYKDVKKMDHAQFDQFCERFYKEGFEDGRKSVPGMDIKEVMERISSVKGIGAKRLEEIRQAIEKDGGLGA